MQPLGSKKIPVPPCVHPCSRCDFETNSNIPYSNALDVADIATLSTRRNVLSRKKFHPIVHPTSSLHSLLPPIEILIYLLVFELPTNSPAYPHELKKISVLCIIRPFLLSNIDSVFTSNILYIPFSIVTLISNVYVVV